MAPNASLNVVSIVTRLGAGNSRHRDSITGNGKRFCYFPNHQGPSLSLSVYKTFCWNTLFFILFYSEVSRIVTYFRNSILVIPSPSLINMTYTFKFCGPLCSHCCNERIIVRYQNLIILLKIIWLPFESSRCQNLTPQHLYPLTRPYTVIALENTLRKSIYAETC
jgi:hypothetical protein